VLSVRGLTKIYPGPVTALNGIDLDVASGMFGLLGPNGAGKSTFMKILAGLLEPTSGTATLDGADILADPESLWPRLGYLPQEFGFYPHLSGEAMLAHLLALKGVETSGGRKKLAAALLERVNLSFAARRSIKGYSGGMRQRLGIAQAIAGNPRFLIVDEPTAGLDPEERARFLDLLTEIASDVVVVLSTHIVDDVSDVCQGMAILVNGTLQCEGNPRTLLESLPGTIWSKSVTREELEGCRQNHAVLGTRWQSGRLVVHILNRDRPAEGFEPVSQDLRDLYFHTISNATKSA